ncbi:hypothetical protein Baya_8535 [Bagarius yarrelli]|uniref:Apolipoprotein M n=1 Tax=Bagarius yarrelli TaxID=175774 RepID=A0A556U5X9_BAGYA|nr:hypothetical protein Baya_8535 [Bagarius yarrelli]
MIILKILGLIYAVAQVLVPCLPPVPLSSDVLSTDQYLGKWYYVGVASWDNEDIESFKKVDNSVVELKKSENDTLIMSGALHQDDQCLHMTWTYHIDPELDPLMTEGPARSEQLSEDLVQNFKSKINCFDVIDQFVISPRTKGVSKLFHVFSSFHNFSCFLYSSAMSHTYAIHTRWTISMPNHLFYHSEFCQL